jgi:hypothetical protein
MRLWRLFSGVSAGWWQFLDRKNYSGKSNRPSIFSMTISMPFLHSDYRPKAEKL